MDPDVAVERATQLRAARYLALALVVGGALLGVVWELWSPPGPAGIRLPSGIQPDETEAWVAADGRFAVIVAAVGLVAGVGAWSLRRARGPAVVFALVGGGLAGSALTAWVGHLLRDSGKSATCYYGSTKAECIEHLPLSLHMTGLVLLEPAIATLLYGLLVAFATRDDLGRPDPARDRLSVGAGEQPEYRGGYGDGPGSLQESGFSPQ